MIEHTFLRNLRYLCQQREDVRRKAVETFRTIDAGRVDLGELGPLVRFVMVCRRPLGQSSKEKQTTQVVASMDSNCNLHSAGTQLISKVVIWGNLINSCVASTIPQYDNAAHDFESLVSHLSVTCEVW